MDKVKKILKLVILLLCIVYIIKYFYSNWDSLRVTFKISRIAIAFILVVSVTSLLTIAYRFKIIMHKCSSINPPFWKWFRVIMMAKFYNLFFAPSGNIYRAIELKRKFNISYTDYVSASVSFTWMDLILDLIFSEIVILSVKPDLMFGNVKASQFVVLLVAIFICLPILANFLLKKIPLRAAALVWVKSKLSEVMSATLNNIRDTSYLCKVIIWGILFTIQTVTVYYLLFDSFQIKLDIPSIFLFYSLLKISTAFIITPGNIGIQEIAFGFLSSQIGGSMATGILVSTVCRVLGTAIIIIIAVIMGGTGLIQTKNIISEMKNDKA